MNKLLPFLVVSLFFLCLIPIGSSDINVTPDWNYGVGNETYSFTQNMTFDQIIISDNWIEFNNTDFNITSANNIYINLIFLHENYSNASYGDELLEFNADTSGGNVDFSLSGFNSSARYTVRRDGIIISTPMSRATGVINFSNSVWSEQTFEILRGSAPTISNEDPSNSSTIRNNGVNWTVNISDYVPFNYTIECSNGQSASDNTVSNNTFFLNLLGLSSNTVHTIWVNATNGNVSSGEWFLLTYSPVSAVETRDDSYSPDKEPIKPIDNVVVLLLGVFIVVVAVLVSLVATISRKRRR